MNFGRYAFLRALGFAAAAGAVLLLMPRVIDPYPLFILSHALVIAIACMGLNLLYGIAGLLSLGHAAYFGAAAYAGGFLYRFFAVESLEIYLLASVLFSSALSVAIGFLCVRTTRIHFVILTLAFSMILHSLIIDGAIFALFGPMGWALYMVTEGSLYIPRLTILGVEHSPTAFVPALYNVIIVAFVLSILLLWRVNQSPFGLALRGIRDSESRAAFIGIPVRRYRWFAFVLSGTIVGLSGALYGPLARQITPEQLHWLFSASLVLAIIIGGTRRFLGPVLGAFVYVGLDEYAVSWIGYRGMALGILLITAVFAFPGGLAELISRAIPGMRGRRGD